MLCNFNPRSRKGATYQVEPLEQIQNISIHAPARERRRHGAGGLLQYSFQSTLPQGSDFNDISVKLPSEISIHAPARERHMSATNQLAILSFQSTLPQGSDDFGYLFTSDGENFNPRSRKGATVFLSVGVDFYQISIHAPARERQ